MSGVISSVKRFLGFSQNPPLSRKRPLDRDSEDDDFIEVSSGKKQKLELVHEDESPCSPKKIVSVFTSPLKSLALMGSNMSSLLDFRGPEKEITFQQSPEVVDLTEIEEVPKQRLRDKSALNSEIKMGRNPVTIQASEPTRLESDQNEVHLLKVVNPNTPSTAAENDAAVEYDSPLKTFEGFSENDKCPVSHEKSSYSQQGNEPQKRMMIVTSKEKERRKKNTSPGALTKSLKTGYKSVHDKLFFSERNLLNRNTIGDKFKRKKSTAVKEAFKLEEKIKYYNILNNFSSSRNSHFISYVSPGFTTLRTPSAGITREKADTSTTKKKMDRILTSTARKPDFAPPTPVVTLDSSFTKGGCEGGTFDASKIHAPSFKMPSMPSIKSPGFKNSLEVSLQTNPVYSPLFLQELREKYDRKHREVDRKIAETNIKKKFYEDKNEETQEEIEERIMKHMKITQADVAEEDTYDEEEEELELPEITPEMEEVIRRARQSGGQVLVDSHKIQITRKDIDTLQGLNWLNDEIINFYLQMIVERSAQKGLKVYATNTFFYPKMMSSGQPALKRWTKKVDIFEQDIMLIPVHLGMHWCLAVVDFRKPGVYYYDSMGGNNRQCLTTLLKYLQDEHRDKKGKELDVDTFERKIMKDIPQQMNGSDCGMFACKFAEYISRGAPITFSQQDMPYFRKRMIWEIVKDTLLHP